MGKKKGEKDEDSNVNADDIPADSREMVQRLKEIVNLSEQEIYAMLVECDMDVNKAIDRLLSQETSDAQGTCKQLAGSSTTSSIPGPYPYNSDLANGETKIVPISSAEAAPSLYVPSSSDLPNVETKGVPISSGKAVPSLSMRRSRLIPPWDGGISSQRTMADVVKMALGLSKEGVTEAPVKDDCPLHEKPDVTNPSSNTLVGSDARRDQLRESASVSNQNLPDDNVRKDQLREPALGLSKKSVTETPIKDDCPLHEKPDVADPFSNSFVESDARRDQLRESASISNHNLCDDGVTNPLSNSFIEPAARRDQLQESALISNQNLPDDRLSYYLSIFEPAAWRDQLQDESASIANQNLRNDSQRLNPTLERSIQMQSSNTFPNVMHQGAYTREPVPQYSAFPFNQSMPTASSLGRRRSTSMNEALRTATIFVPQRNQQAMNHHYSHPQVPLAHYGNMTNSPYLPPMQNNSYNMPPPSIFPQHGGSNNNTYYHQPLASMLPEYRNSHLPQSAAAIVPSAYGSAYVVGTSSDNAANSRFGYEDVLSSQFNGSIRLPSIQHQNVNSNVWRVQGEDTFSLVPRYRNHQSPSFRQSRQQQQEQHPYRGLDYERSSSY